MTMMEDASKIEESDDAEESEELEDAGRHRDLPGQANPVSVQSSSVFSPKPHRD
jgi:hypothetical protein